MFLKKKLVPVVTALLLVLVSPVASFAQDGSPAQQISLSQAVTMAQSSNVSLAQSQTTAQQADNLLNSDAQNFSGVIPGNVFSNPQAAQGYLAKINADYQDQYAWKNYAYEKNDVIYQTESAYFAVQDAVYGEHLAEKSLELAQDNYNIAQLLMQQGIDTVTDVSSAKSSLDTAQSKLTAAKASIDAAYANFDQTVGLDPSARPDLTTSATYDPNYFSGLVNIDQAVSQAIEDNPQAFIAQENVFLQNMLQPYSNPIPNGPLNYEQALLSQQQTIQTLTLSVRNAYLAVSNAQDAYNATQESLTTAQAGYDNAQAEYQAGVITKVQLLEAEYGQGGSSSQSNQSGQGQTSQSSSTSGSAKSTAQQGSNSQSSQSIQGGGGGTQGYFAAQVALQSALHTLLLDRSYLALLTGVGSVTVPTSGQ